MSGRRKWRRAERAEREAQERREPSWERTWMSRRRDQTVLPARRQRDSVGRAEERRKVVSRRVVRWCSRSDWLEDELVSYVLVHLFWWRRKGVMRVIEEIGSLTQI